MAMAAMTPMQTLTIGTTDRPEAVPLVGPAVDGVAGVAGVAVDGVDGAAGAWADIHGLTARPPA